jgi:hypothetical protein
VEGEKEKHVVTSRVLVGESCDGNEKSFLINLLSRLVTLTSDISKILISWLICVRGNSKKSAGAGRQIHKNE